MAILYPVSRPKPDRAEDLIGYIDSLGRIVVEPTYEAGSYFSEGMAAVRLDDGSTGMIDEEGDLRIVPRFEGLGRFQEGLCSAHKGLLSGYIDIGGAWRVEPQFLVASEFSEGLACVSPDGETFGYVDVAGSLSMRPRFEGAGRFRAGLAAVRRDGQWGYIDRAGRTVIAHQFDGPRAQPFTHGLAGVCLRGRWGFIGTSGDWVVMPQYDDVMRFREGFAPVQRDGLWGLVSSLGRATLLPKYDQIGEFHGGGGLCLTGRESRILLRPRRLADRARVRPVVSVRWPARRGPERGSILLSSPKRPSRLDLGSVCRRTGTAIRGLKPIGVLGL